MATAEETEIAASGSISPDSYSAEVWVGETLSLERTVTVNIEDIVSTTITSSAPEKLDVLFLADNTDSMGNAIDNVQGNAQNLLQTLTNTYGDVQIGVARYYGDPKETTETYEPYGQLKSFSKTYTYQQATTCETSQGESYNCYEYLIEQTISDGSFHTWRAKLPLSKYEQFGDNYTRTWEGYRHQKTSAELGATAAYELQESVNGGTIADAIAAIDSWSASSGKDWSEGNFFALHQAATSGMATATGYSTGYNTGWREDAKKIIVWFGDAKSHTDTLDRAEVIQALNAQDISVIAIHTNSTDKSYTDGLDANSQASTIASVTNGQYASVYSSELSDTITALIGTTVEETSVLSPGIDLIFETVEAPEGLDITYTCTDALGCNNVKDGETRTFRMDITATDAGTYSFQTVVRDVAGAEATNDINAKFLYAD